jgi:superfamily II DNA or RNA helicase
MLERVRRVFDSIWPAPTLRVRVEKSCDPASGLFFVRLLDDDGVALDGAEGIDSFAGNFVHRGKWARIPRKLKPALARIAEHGGRWVPDRGFAIREEDFPDAARALETVETLRLSDAPDSPALKVDARPMEPCEIVELEGGDEPSLRRDVAFTDADGAEYVSPAVVREQSERTWIRTGNGWRKRPRETKAELDAIAREATAPPLTGDDVPYFLAKQLAEAKRTGRRILLQPRAAAARVLEGEWLPHAAIDADGDKLHIKLTVRSGDVEIPWKQVEAAKNARYLPIRRDTWVRNDRGARKRTEEALSEIPQLRAAPSGDTFDAPAYALPAVQEAFSSIGSINLSASAQRLFEQLHDFTKIESVPVPRSLRAELRPYQKKGLDWLGFLRRYGFGGILADDMGLGKTLQTCSVILHAIESGQDGASLVVCPASVQSVWQQEIRKWCVGLEPVLLVPGDRGPYLRAPRPNTVGIASYQAVMRYSEAFQRPVWNYLVLDEAHRVKNHTTATAKACKGILARHKLAVTGTPIQNRLQELWALFDSIMPDYLGNAGSFTRRFATPIEKEKNEAVADRLRRRIDPFKLRRLKAQVAADLPPLTRQLRSVPLLTDQRRIYSQILNELGVPEVLRNLHDRGDALKGLAKLLRLRQVCAHPRILERSIPLRGSSAKFEALCDILEESLEEDHKVLVFTQWTQMAALIMEMLSENKIAHSYIDGSVSIGERAELVQAFQRPDGPSVMVISLLAGGEGITLTEADTVIMYDRWWNPAVEEQAFARAHRIGQRRPVTAYVLESADTIEERLARILQRKQALAEDLVHVDALEKRITREQLIAVLEEELAAASSNAPRSSDD